MLFALTLFYQKSIKQLLRQSDKTMARPIKDTPDLKGKDARRFFDKMDNVQKVSPEELARIKKSASRFVFVND